MNTLHDGLRLRLQVNVPIDLEPEAAALLESFRSGFQFVDPDDPAPARADLAALEGVLEGSFETPWHPVELELAAVEAAGLQRPGDPPWEEWIAAADTVRQVVRFENGVMTNYCAIDSRPLEICWESQYRLLDDHTIEANEGTYRSVYEFTLRDGILTLDLVDSSHPLDWAPLTATFETLPFTRIP